MAVVSPLASITISQRTIRVNVSTQTYCIPYLLTKYTILILADAEIVGNTG